MHKYFQVLLHTAIDHYRVDEESKGESVPKEESPKMNNFLNDDKKGNLGKSFRDSNLVHR